MSLFGASSSSGQPNNNTTTSTTSAGGGLFGSSTTPTTLSGGLFGGQSQSTPTFSFGSAASGGNSTATTLGTPGGGLFGNTSTKPAEQKPLFGAATSAPSASSTPSLGGASENLFGGSSLTPSGASMFGSKPGATSTGTGNSLFGNTSLTPNITATSTTPTTTAPTGKIFGQENPVANQGASTVKPGGLFGGAAATGASLFGGANSNATSAAQATPAKPAFPLNSTTPAGAPPSNTSKPSGTANLFGSTGNTTSQSGSSLFPTAQQGEKKENQTTNLFANQASSQSKPATTQPAASLFPAAGQPQKTAPSLFGATKPAESPSLFGAKPATQATTEGAGSKSGAGSASGLSLFGQQAQPRPAEAAPPVKPAGSLFASAPASNPTSASAPAPATTQGGSLFGGANKLTTGATTTEPPKTQPSLFGTTPASTAAASTTTTTAPSSSTPASTSASAPSTTATSTTAAAPTGSLFGNATKAAPAAESVAPKPATSQTTGLGASTSGPTSSMARLKNRTMDEILNRWATDLSKYQKEFKEQASQVAAWDRLLVENGDKIQKLYLNTFEAEKASREVERHLVTVESQQEELESWLDKYEVEVDTLFSKQIGSGEQLAGPDQERERTYKLAEKITERLDEMGRDLSKMIKEINDISGTVSKGSKPDDPLSQIVRVLNGHLTQLQWIDANATALQAKVTAAQKASSQIGNQYGGPEQDNVDSFYRSYIGRR